ncbi:ATP-dependent DNA helicase [Gloeothece citriformis PCC 7424]|uniref:ATP-dependent DNA helicase n=1 Tax=Gloeothece citriformis (strain PCC 7424) TaxID=65393 RepID=B7K9Y8_GLOC7|nr:helicase C-terminal domain-containing protein [Gloeothece citriformis]ACK71344.1 ATP-dependent DNA helicase [Gloeothece citriformis PCC 7424]
MVLLEAEVHSSLLGYLRTHNRSNWIHHLTMARIVSRALRLQRSALIQTGSTSSRYNVSYLTPALLTDSPLILVVPEFLQEKLLQVDIPQLQEWLESDKSIYAGDRWPFPEFDGVMVTSPQAWLSDRVEKKGYFPPDIPTLIEGANELEEWARTYLTVSIVSQDWNNLIDRCCAQAEFIRDVRVKLTKEIFNRPKNPYECYLIEQYEKDLLQDLCDLIASEIEENSPFVEFCRQSETENQILWISVDREKGQFTLHSSPVKVADDLRPIWQQQPIVFMGGFLDSEKEATIYRQKLGIGDLLCLKFNPNRSSEYIHLYLPARLPLPNTPEFKTVLIQQTYRLVSLCYHIERPIVIVVDDVPLKAQVGSVLAAEFGSRVVVERQELEKNAILVCGWNFWHQNQELFPTPQLLVIATLPIPSPENPLVAAQVTYYKNQRQDWFRVYLLPTALKEIQRAVMPLRESQGVVALLDSRVNFRSYGTQILTALEPYAGMNYIDNDWFF